MYLFGYLVCYYSALITNSCLNQETQLPYQTFSINSPINRQVSNYETTTNRLEYTITEPYLYLNVLFPVLISAPFGICLCVSIGLFFIDQFIEYQGSLPRSYFGDWWIKYWLQTLSDLISTDNGTTVRGP